MIDLSPGSKTRKFLNEEFQQIKHNDFRSWYFNKFTKEELIDFKNNYYSYMEKTGDILTHNVMKHVTRGC